MPRYVDLDKLPIVNIDVDTVNRTAYVDIREVQQALRQAEAYTGEVAPVVHGEWIGKPISGYSNVRCSNCRSVYSDNNGMWNYCPNCGCLMDGCDDE